MRLLLWALFFRLHGGCSRWWEHDWSSERRRERERDDFWSFTPLLKAGCFLKTSSLVASCSVKRLPTAPASLQRVTIGFPQIFFPSFLSFLVCLLQAVFTLLRPFSFIFCAPHHGPPGSAASTSCCFSIMEVSSSKIRLSRIIITQ